MDPKYYGNRMDQTCDKLDVGVLGEKGVKDDSEVLPHLIL